jgi:hypothetical protein
LTSLGPPAGSILRSIYVYGEQMKTLLTLNLNDLTNEEEKKRKDLGAAPLLRRLTRPPADVKALLYRSV